MNGVFLRSVALLLLIALISTSCAPLPPPGTALTEEERESAKRTCIAKYTVVGVAGGALVGLLLGKGKAGGAAIGAAAGGVLAFALAWGHCLSVYSDLKSFPVAGMQETAQRVGYVPEQGNVTKVEGFSLDPEGVAPGGKVKMDGTYYVMAPEGTEVKVTESRSLSFFDPAENQWKDLGTVDNEITSALGTRRAEGNFDVPADAPEGRYRITFKVAAKEATDQATRELTVKKGLAMGPGSGVGDKQPEQPAVTGSEGGKSPSEATPTSKEKVSTIKVASKTLSVRKAASSKSGIVTTLQQDQIFEVIEMSSSSEGKWFKIRLDDGTEGWVSGKYVERSE